VHVTFKLLICSFDDCNCVWMCFKLHYACCVVFVWWSVGFFDLMRFGGVLNVIDAKVFLICGFVFVLTDAFFSFSYMQRLFWICGFSLDDGNVFLYDHLLYKSKKVKRSSEEIFEVNEEVKVISNFSIKM